MIHLTSDLSTIEFQKCGLPHAHILLFLHSANKYPTPGDINKIISVEIPTEEDDRKLYHLVKTHMTHDLCGLANKYSPCMKNGKCSKYFPKNFQATIVVDWDGYPVYRRIQNCNTMMKNHIFLDNRYAISYNPKLLK